MSIIRHAAVPFSILIIALKTMNIQQFRKVSHF
jgi:hypothetical protein